MESRKSRHCILWWWTLGKKEGKVHKTETAETVIYKWHPPFFYGLSRRLGDTPGQRGARVPEKERDGGPLPRGW